MDGDRSQGEMWRIQCQRCREVFQEETVYVKHKPQCDYESRPMLLDDLDRIVDLIRDLEVRLGRVKREVINARKEVKQLHEVDRL